MHSKFKVSYMRTIDVRCLTLYGTWLGRLTTSLVVFVRHRLSCLWHCASAVKNSSALSSGYCFECSHYECIHVVMVVLVLFADLTNTSLPLENYLYAFPIVAFPIHTTGKCVFQTIFSVSGYPLFVCIATSRVMFCSEPCCRCLSLPALLIHLPLLCPPTWLLCWRVRLATVLPHMSAD